MLNVRKFTQNREQTEQHVSIATDERLQGLVNLPVAMQLALSGDVVDKRPILQGKVTSEVTATCQVCNEIVKWQHQFAFDVHPVVEDELDSLDDIMDPVIITEGMLDLDDLLVNELILSLPTVVTHAQVMGEDCSANVSMSVGDKIAEKPSPFAVLEQLKSSKLDDE